MYQFLKVSSQNPNCTSLSMLVKCMSNTFFAKRSHVLYIEVSSWPFHDEAHCWDWWDSTLTENVGGSEFSGCHVGKPRDSTQDARLFSIYEVRRYKRRVECIRALTVSCSTRDIEKSRRPSWTTQIKYSSHTDAGDQCWSQRDLHTLSWEQKVWTVYLLSGQG